MITWRKLLILGQFIALSLAILPLSHCCLAVHPILGSISPLIGVQGTDVVVTLQGSFRDPCGPYPRVWVNGGLAAGITWDRPPTSYDDLRITTTFHIAANATPGVYPVTVRTEGGVTDIKYFTVTCPGCPPVPRLASVAAYLPSPIAPLTPGGPPVTFQFFGANFLNHNPQVQIDGPGISFYQGPYVVLGGLGLEYFFAEVTADASAQPAAHNVTVITDGGTSNAATITVDASQPPPPPTPGTPPVLNGITPRHISKGNAAGAYIKCEGSGFGSRREVLFGGKDFFFTFATYNANSDTVAVALYSAYALPDNFVTVQVHNLDNNTVSNEHLLILDEADPNAPAVGSPPFGVNRGSEADVAIFGTNLLGVTEQSLSPIRGVTFSNVQPCGANNPECPGTSSDQGFSVHVSTDATAPFTRDEATNLTISTSNGQSGPFDFLIGVPPGP